MVDQAGNKPKQEYIMNNTQRSQLLSVDEYPVSPTTMSAAPTSYGEALPTDFFKRIVASSEHLNTKFALSKENRLYEKLDEFGAWKIFLENDARFSDIGIGHGKIYGIGQDDSLLYEIDEKDKSVKQVDNQVKLESIVDVQDNKVIAVAAANGAEITFDGKVWTSM